MFPGSVGTDRDGAKIREGFAIPTRGVFGAFKEGTLLELSGPRTAVQERDGDLRVPNQVPAHP